MLVLVPEVVPLLVLSVVLVLVVLVLVVLVLVAMLAGRLNEQYAF